LIGDIKMELIQSESYVFDKLAGREAQADFTVDNVLRHVHEMVEYILNDTKGDEDATREYVGTLQEELIIMITHLDLCKEGGLNLVDDHHMTRDKLAKANRPLHNLYKDYASHLVDEDREALMTNARILAEEEGFADDRRARLRSTLKWMS